MADRRHRDIPTLAAAFVFIFFGASVQQVLVPILSEVHGWDGPAVRTAVLTAVYVSFALWRNLIGYVLRAFGGRAVIIIGASTYALFFASVFKAPSPEALVALGAVWGFGAACLWTGASTAVLNASASDRYGRVAGFFHAGTHLGFAAGVFTLVLVGKTYGYGAVEWCVVPATVVGALIASRVSAGQARAERPSLSLAGRVLLSPRGACVALFMFVSSSAFGIMLGPFVDHLSATQGLSALHIAGLFALARLVMTYAGGSLSDRVGRANVMFGGFAIASLGLFVGSMSAGSLAAMVLCVICLGLQSEVVPSAALALIGDHAGAARRPIVHGLLFAWRDLGVVLALQVGGLLWRSGLDFFLVFGALFGLCALLAALLRRATEERWASL